MRPFSDVALPVIDQHMPLAAAVAAEVKLVDRIEPLAGFLVEAAWHLLKHLLTGSRGVGHIGGNPPQTGTTLSSTISTYNFRAQRLSIPRPAEIDSEAKHITGCDPNQVLTYYYWRSAHRDRRRAIAVLRILHLAVEICALADHADVDAAQPGVLQLLLDQGRISRPILLVRGDTV